MSDIDYRNLMQKAVDLALNSGAKEVIAKIVDGSEYQIRLSNSEIDISKQWNNRILEVLLSIGRRIDVVSIQDPTFEKIKRIIPEKLSSIRKTPKTLLYWGMQKKKIKGNSNPDLYDKQTVELYETAPNLVETAVNAALSEGAKKVAGAFYFGHKKTGVLTGYGNGGVYDSSYYNFTIRSFVDAESSGQDNIVGRNLTDIKSKFESAGHKSGKIAKMATGGKQGDAGTYDLIMSPTVAANVLGYMIDGANPVYMIGKMSCLGKSMNKVIGPENLTIYDDSTISEGLNSRPFDYEGFPAQKTPLIENGKLTGLIQNTSSAKIWKLLGRFRSKSTSNSFLGSVALGDFGPKVLAPLPTNRVFEPGDKSFDDMVSESKKPTIYVTSNWYTRFTSNIEGIFSTIPRDGIFLIEDGEIKKPIRKIRIADNLLRMTKNISEIGNDVTQIQWWEVETPTFIPHIKVKDVPITTATK